MNTGERRQEFTNSEEYAQMNEDERIEHLLAMTHELDIVMEVIQGEQPDDSQDLQMIPPIPLFVPENAEEDLGYINHGDIVDEDHEEYLDAMDEEYEPPVNE